MNVTVAETRVFAEIERLTPVYEGFLRELVAVPSPLGEEGAAQDLVAARMRSFGVAPDCFEVDPARLVALPGFNPTAREYSGRPCVVGRLPGKGGGRSLILNAHVDTAPLGDPSRWSEPPCAGVVRGRTLFGRGAWDDKAGIAECLLVMEAFRCSGVELAGDLVVKSVVEDEVTGNGTLACLARGHTADGAIIVDGTWPERFVVSHMGQVWFRVRLRGRSVPACVAARGSNPARGIAPLLAAFEALVRRKNAGRCWGAASAPVFINIGRIEAGRWPGSVPAECLLEGQFGFCPPDDNADAKRELAEAIAGIVAGVDWPLDESPILEFFGLDTPGVVGDPDSALVRTLRATVERLRGRPLVENRVTGHADLRHYLGWRPAIPCCLYGPGAGKNAHVEDERFELDDLRRMAENLASFALAWSRGG